ncbi:hypothetical protein L7F22_020121 [Adiantum nelumboides]|nr:hypothetical protein [Adiantum nelumboides]
MTDYRQEQEMEIEALQAILMDDIKEISSADCSLRTTFPCFQITVSPKDDDEEEPTSIPGQEASVVGYRDAYYAGDLDKRRSTSSNVFTLTGGAVSWRSRLQDNTVLSTTEAEYAAASETCKEAIWLARLVGDLGISAEAMENLGMAMMYTLVTSAKEWLRERYNETFESEGEEESDEEEKDEVIELHGEAVTVETFLAWRERFEAELALERARYGLNFYIVFSM